MEAILILVCLIAYFIWVAEPWGTSKKDRIRFEEAVRKEELKKNKGTSD